PTPHFLCFVTRRLPSSTLFPYTTLFRSTLTRAAHDTGVLQHPQVLGHRLHADVVGRGQLVDGGIAGGEPSHEVAACGIGERREQDRKSTRLNSSHVKISYAVFCLKKKTK